MNESTRVGLNDMLVSLRCSVCCRRSRKFFPGRNIGFRRRLGNWQIDIPE